MASRQITMRAGESIFVDYLKKDGIEIDTNMEASYELLDSSDVVKLSGALSKSTDLFTFELRITGTATEVLTDGTYVLLVKVYNLVDGYSDYIYEENVKIRS